jgi:hypothetical protein
MAAAAGATATASAAATEAAAHEVEDILTGWTCVRMMPGACQFIWDWKLTLAPSAHIPGYGGSVQADVRESSIRGVGAPEGVAGAAGVAGTALAGDMAGATATAQRQRWLGWQPGGRSAAAQWQHSGVGFSV